MPRFPVDPRRKSEPRPRQKGLLRAAIRVRDGNLCCYCKCEMDFGSYRTDIIGTRQPLNGATLEHIVPFALGGSFDLDNLRLACRGCNQRLGRALHRQRTLETAVLPRRLIGAWPALTETIEFA